VIIMRDRLQQQIRVAGSVTPELMAEVTARACPRYAAAKRGGTAGRIRRLIEVEAWTEAALALIDLELPQWKVRCLAYEDGFWHCSLSRWHGLPVELDETADARHETLPLSILSAFLDAQRDLEVPAARPKPAPQVRLIDGVAACCENFC
jgi:hypothetical protein